MAKALEESFGQCLFVSYTFNVLVLVIFGKAHKK